MMKRTHPPDQPKIKTAKQFVKALLQYGSLRAVYRHHPNSWNGTGDMNSLACFHRVAVADGLMEKLRPGHKPNHVVIAHAKKKSTKGRVKVRKAAELQATPDKRGVKRFLFTSAQNNTKVHPQFWANLLAFADHHKAALHVSRFCYVRAGLGAVGDKTDIGRVRDKASTDFWWDDKIVPYLSDERALVAPGLIWVGEMNIMPTAVRPLSGLEVYTGRASGIFPHVKIAMESIASGKREATKFNYTTGTVTVRNYIHRKEGLKAQFHHCYGALLVEVNEDGNWWCRQINADSTGTFYDLDVQVRRGKVTTGHRVEAITKGDVHVAQLDEDVDECTWSEGGLIDKLNPRYQFLHDVLDFYSQNHHEIGNPHTTFRKYCEGMTNVRKELEQCRDFFNRVRRKSTKTIVVDSNHHHHLGRWLREQDGRRDPSNVECWLDLSNRMYKHIREHLDDPNYLKMGMESVGLKFGGDIKFLDEDESFILCEDAHGGIEGGWHGDLGPNGSRGAPIKLARLGRKSNTGHTHTACIIDGIYVAGTSSILDPKYVRGPSSWSHSDIVTYRNGKRAILTIWAGRAYA